MGLIGSEVDDGLRRLSRPCSSNCLEPSREAEGMMVSLPVLLVRVMFLVIDFDVQRTTGRSVGRQAPTIPTQISTPDHIAAGASRSGMGLRNAGRRCWEGWKGDVLTAGVFVRKMHVRDTPDTYGADAD